jgi:hypothetical protein
MLHPFFILEAAEVYELTENTRVSQLILVLEGSPFGFTAILPLSTLHLDYIYLDRRGLFEISEAL